MPRTLKTHEEFVNDMIAIAQRPDNVYILGGWGARADDANKTYYIGKNQFNRDRAGMIRALPNYFWFFDCVNLIKGYLWGWVGDLTKPYGGAIYASNGVPDIDDTQFFNYCYDRSYDWTHIVPGEAVWKQGHIGVYIGNGLAVECTPMWDNKVQITAVDNMGKVDGYNQRKWTAHGKIPWISYEPVLNGLVKDGNQYYLYRSGKLINSPSEHFVDGFYYIHSNGKIAMGEDVHLPYVFKDEDNWSDEEKKQVAYDIGRQVVGEDRAWEYGKYLYDCMKNKTGKWVRYDKETAKMVYGASIKDGNFYFFDPITGAMLKGESPVAFNAVFDPITGVMTNINLA